MNRDEKRSCRGIWTLLDGRCAHAAGVSTSTCHIRFRGSPVASGGDGSADTAAWCSRRWKSSTMLPVAFLVTFRPAKPLSH